MRKKSDGSYNVYTDNGRHNTGVDAVKWAAQVQARGAGEIILTAIDREGTGLGFDVELTAKITKHSKIPVVASGGAGRPDHLDAVKKLSKPQGISIASMLHYNDTALLAAERDYASKINEFSILTEKLSFGRICPTSIKELTSLIGERYESQRHVN